MAAFVFEFEWDPVKAQTNFAKHGVDFERAATVFLDPVALTIPDVEHSETEVRWITLWIRCNWLLCIGDSHIRATDSGPRACSIDFGAKANEGGSSQLRGTTMTPKYDFSKGERGKFFRPNAELRLPIYLDADLQAYLTERAAQTGVRLGDMVNGLLKQGIQLIESGK